MRDVSILDTANRFTTMNIEERTMLHRPLGDRAMHKIDAKDFHRPLGERAMYNFDSGDFDCQYLAPSAVGKDDAISTQRNLSSTLDMEAQAFTMMTILIPRSWIFLSPASMTFHIQITIGIFHL
jgi:hypothetical protein